MSDFSVLLAKTEHKKYAGEISRLYAQSAGERGTGIAKRPEEYINRKIEEGKAVICLHKDGRFAGFCYIETWSNANYVVNSGLIVHPDFRHQGLARKIKKKVFDLSRKMYPNAKIFGLTTSLAVMKINSELGYRPVTFSEITQDDQFWQGCSSCVNYDILNRTNRRHCLCTGMLYEPDRKPGNGRKRQGKGLKIYERWLRFKRYVLLKQERKKNKK